MTGFGGCRGVWVKKSLAQPPVSSAADRESRARKLRGMGLGPALRAVAGAAAARQVDRHADAEMRSGVLPSMICTVPPWSATNSNTTERPIPVPLTAVLLAARPV